MTYKISKPEEEWKKILTSEQFDVCRKKGTERAFTGIYWDTKDSGTYKCSCQALVGQVSLSLLTKKT